MTKMNARRKRHRTWQLQEAGEFEEYKKTKDTLIDFFKNAPFPEIELEVERDRDSGRDIELEI